MLWGLAALVCAERAQQCLSHSKCLMDTRPFPVPAMKATVLVTNPQGLGMEVLWYHLTQRSHFTGGKNQGSDRDGDLSKVTVQGNGRHGTRTYIARALIFCFFNDSRLVTTSLQSCNQMKFNVSRMEIDESISNMLLEGVKENTFWPNRKCLKHTLLFIKHTHHFLCAFQVVTKVLRTQTHLIITTILPGSIFPFYR